MLELNIMSTVKNFFFFLRSCSITMQLPLNYQYLASLQYAQNRGGFVQQNKSNTHKPNNFKTKY